MRDDIKYFVINLPESSDRKLNISRQLDNYGIKPIFIEAVNGKNLDQLEINRYCNQNKAKEVFGRELFLGEIGCALSHKKIYQKIVDEDIGYAVILEDDALVRDKFTRAVNLIIGSKLDWDLILLGHYKGFNKNSEIASIFSFWDRFKLQDRFVLGRIVKGGLGTHGYILNKNGAIRLLEYLDKEKITCPIDIITSNLKVINVYGLTPTVIGVDVRFDSLIDNNQARNHDREGELVYELAKVIRKTPFFNSAQKMWFYLLRIKPIRKY